MKRLLFLLSLSLVPSTARAETVLLEVTDPALRPLPGVRVWIGRAELDARSQSGVSDRQGRLTLAVFEAGLYELSARSSGYGYPTISKRIELGGERERSVRLSFSDGPGVRGRVIDDHGKPVRTKVVVWPNVRIATVALDRIEVSTDEDGRYAIHGLRAGPWIIHSGEGVVYAEQKFEMGENTMELDLVMLHRDDRDASGRTGTGAIRVVAIDALTKERVLGYGVEIDGDETEVIAWYPGSHYDDDGTYISHLDPDDYQLIVAADGYAHVWSHIALGPGEIRTVEVMLAGGGVTLSGYLHEHHDPITNAYLALIPAERTDARSKRVGVAHTNTLGDGSFELRGVTPGRYSLRVMTSGKSALGKWESTNFLPVTVSVRGGHLDFDLAQLRGRLRIAVAAPPTKPLAVLVYSGIEGSDEKYADPIRQLETSQMSGPVVFERLAPGPHVVEIPYVTNSGDDCIESDEVLVPKSGTASVELEIDPAAPCE